MKISVATLVHLINAGLTGSEGTPVDDSPRLFEPRAPALAPTAVAPPLPRRAAPPQPPVGVPVMTRCRQCGNLLPATANFCGKCSCPINGRLEPNRRPATAPRVRLHWVFYVIAAALVALVLLVAHQQELL
jgi:hypothetical protein